MELSNQEYDKMVQAHAKTSPTGKNMLWAFMVGGTICMAGQVLGNFYQSRGLSQDQAGLAVSVTIIGITALFTALGVFDKLAKHAGAGTLVPITGFANAMVSPAVEFKTEGLVSGMAAKMFTVAGPVLAYGITASVIYGLLLWIFQYV